MKKLISYLPILLAILFLTESCDKKEDTNNVIGDVEMYLLESYETIDNTMQINESTVVLKPDVFINYSNMVSYNQSSYTFKITDETKTNIKNLESELYRHAFAITANKKVVYTGYFWSSYSSMICDWVCIDPIMIDYYDGLEVNLGYPGLMDGMVIPDKRNDSQITAIFKRDNKWVN